MRKLTISDFNKFRETCRKFGLNEERKPGGICRIMSEECISNPIRS